MNSRIAASLLAAMLALGALLTGCSSDTSGIATPANFTRTPDDPFTQAQDMVYSGMFGSSFGAIDIDILGGDIFDLESILGNIDFSDNPNDWYPIPSPPSATGATKAAAESSPASMKAMATITALAKSQLMKLAASGSKTGASDTATIDFTDENGTAWLGSATLTVSDTAYAGAINFNVTGTNGSNTITLSLSGNASISSTGKAILSGKFNIGANLLLDDTDDRTSGLTLESSFGGTINVDAQFMMGTTGSATGDPGLPFGDLSSLNCRLTLKALTSIDGARVLDANLNCGIRLIGVVDSRRFNIIITISGEQLFVARDGYWVKKKQDVTLKINVNTPNSAAGTFWLRASDGLSMQLDLPTSTGTVKNAAGTVIANITPETESTMRVDFIDPEITDLILPLPIVAILFNGDII